MARIENANTIINRAATEVGLTPSADPLADVDQSYVQMVGLLSAAGQELIELYSWQRFVKTYSFNTTSDDQGSGTYNLPDDFCYMIDQTGWDRTNKLAVGGPLSAQDWTYLKGRDLAQSTIYVSFRLWEGNMRVFPDNPVPGNLDIRFEYMSRYWASDFDETAPSKDTVTVGSDKVYYEPILIVKYLKAKWLESKGFDPSTARLEFENMFLSRSGKDKGAPILNAGGPNRSYPYLNPFHSLPDTNYGL